MPTAGHSGDADAVDQVGPQPGQHRAVQAEDRHEQEQADGRRARTGGRWSSAGRSRAGCWAAPAAAAAAGRPSAVRSAPPRARCGSSARSSAGVAPAVVVAGASATGPPRRPRDPRPRTRPRWWRAAGRSAPTSPAARPRRRAPSASTTTSSQRRTEESRCAITMPMRSSQQPFGGPLHPRLGDRVHPRGRLVEDHHLRVADQDAGERDQLLLPGREHVAALAELGRPGRRAGRRPRRRGPARSAPARPGRAAPGRTARRSRPACRPGSRCAAARSATHRRSCSRSRSTQVGAAEEDRAAGHVDRPGQHLGQGGLAGAGAADDRVGTAPGEGQVHLAQGRWPAGRRPDSGTSGPVRRCRRRPARRRRPAPARASLSS